MFEDVDPDAAPAAITVGDMNLGPLPMGNGLTRLQTRFFGDDDGAGRGRGARPASRSTPRPPSELGLVTFAPDDIDWDEEVRIASRSAPASARTR